jgi:hypothetical protein
MCLIKCGITNAIETLGDGTIQYIMPHIIRHCGRRLAQLPPLRLASRLVNQPTEKSVETPGYDQGSGGHPWLPVRRHPCRESTAAWSGLNGIA